MQLSNGNMTLSRGNYLQSPSYTKNQSAPIPCPVDRDDTAPSKSLYAVGNVGKTASKCTSNFLGIKINMNKNQPANVIR